MADEAVNDEEISWNDFTQVELRIGVILEAIDLPNAKKPAYILQIDFGPKIGIKKSSSQLTDLYSKEELIGKQIVAVINFPKKQIGSIQSECLVTGFYTEKNEIVLCIPDKSAPLGSKLL